MSSWRASTQSSPLNSTDKLSAIAVNKCGGKLGDECRIKARRHRLVVGRVSDPQNGVVAIELLPMMTGGTGAGVAGGYVC